MTRTTLRNDDITSARESQRPLNESLRGISIRLDSMPRREQAWVRFTVSENDGISTIVGEKITGPGYSLAAVVVLAVQLVDSPAAPLTAAPWLSIEPVEGNADTGRILSAFGLPLTGTFDVLVEFVENVTEQWPRTDVTGGVP